MPIAVGQINGDKMGNPIQVVSIMENPFKNDICMYIFNCCSFVWLNAG